MVCESAAPPPVSVVATVHENGTPTVFAVPTSDDDDRVQVIPVNSGYVNAESA